MKPRNIVTLISPKEVVGASDGIRTRTTRLDTDNQALKACVLPLHYTRFLNNASVVRAIAVYLK